MGRQTRKMKRRVERTGICPVHKARLYSTEKAAEEAVIRIRASAGKAATQRARDQLEATVALECEAGFGWHTGRRA